MYLVLCAFIIMFHKIEVANIRPVNENRSIYWSGIFPVHFFVYLELWMFAIRETLHKVLSSIVSFKTFLVIFTQRNLNLKSSFRVSLNIDYAPWEILILYMICMTIGCIWTLSLPPCQVSFRNICIIFDINSG